MWQRNDGPFWMPRQWRYWIFGVKRTQSLSLNWNTQIGFFIILSLRSVLCYFMAFLKCFIADFNYPVSRWMAEWRTGGRTDWLHGVYIEDNVIIYEKIIFINYLFKLVFIFHIKLLFLANRLRDSSSIHPSVLWRYRESSYIISKQKVQLRLQNVKKM